MTKPQRAEFLARQGVAATVVDGVQDDGSTIPVILAAPDESRRPAMPEKVKAVLPGAIGLGLRILAHPRLTSLELPGAWYAEETLEIADRTRLATSAIESKGVGHARLIAYSHELAMRYQFDGAMTHVPDVPLTDREGRLVAAYAAEWADGDAIGSHIGFENDIFCTADRGRNASKPSILDEEHRAWLVASYQLRFMTLEELAERVREPSQR